MNIIRAGLCSQVHHTGRSQPGRERKQRLADPHFLDSAHRHIGSGGAHGFVSDIQAIHLHPRSAAIAANDRSRGKAALRGGEYLTVEHLNSGFKPGQIQKATIGGNLLHLAGGNRAPHFRRLGIHQHGSSNHHSLEFDVTGGSRCCLDSQEKVVGLEAFGLHVQNIFSAHGVGARRTGRGLDGSSGDSGSDGNLSPADGRAPGPGYGSRDVAGGGLLGECQRRNHEKNRDRSDPQN